MTENRLLRPALNKKLDVFIRLVFSTIGSYCLAIIASRALAALLPLSPLEASAGAIMLGFLLFIPISLFLFAAKDALRSALLLAGLCLFFWIAGLFGGV